MKAPPAFAAIDTSPGLQQQVTNSLEAMLCKHGSLAHKLCDRTVPP